MKKVIKVSGYFLLLAALLVSFFYIVHNKVVDFVFDKVYNEVVNEMIAKEKKSEKDSVKNGESEQVNAQPSDEKTVTEEQEAVTPNSPESTPGKESQPATTAPEKGQSSTDIAIKKISELTPQELQEIQALVSTADKTAAINMVKSALTADDKREIKAMLDSGNIDYARCRQIASARLSADQKRQIYAYYEKYARIYFATK